MEREHETEVLVVGAGVAGLSAAVRLRQAGVSVRLLEARERVGGRIHTEHGMGPWPIELGAEFIHGELAATWSLVRSAGIRTVLKEVDHLSFGPSGFKRGAGRAVGRLQELLASYRGADLPFAQALDRWIADRRYPRSERQMAIRYVEGFEAASAERASLSALSEQERAAERIRGEYNYQFVDGYDRVPLALLRSLEDAEAIRLATAVTKVRWRRGEVIVEVAPTGDGAQQHLRARAAVLTLPLGVLQAGDDEPGAVQFVPALPGVKRKAIRALEVGPVIKVLLRFRPRFAWKPLPNLGDVSVSSLGFLHLVDAAVPTFWSLQPQVSPWLIGWAAGPAAHQLAGASPSEVLSQTLTGLSVAFGVSYEALEAELEAWHVVDWQRDRLARGAYTWIPVGASWALAALAEPVEQTLFFAGEATDLKAHLGTVHGAIESGERAADEILTALRPAWPAHPLTT
jgi:monoamine oxidase